MSLREAGGGRKTAGFLGVRHLGTLCGPGRGVRPGNERAEEDQGVGGGGAGLGLVGDEPLACRAGDGEDLGGEMELAT